MNIYTNCYTTLHTHATFLMWLYLDIFRHDAIIRFLVNYAIWRNLAAIMVVVYQVLTPKDGLSHPQHYLSRWMSIRSKLRPNFAITPSLAPRHINKLFYLRPYFDIHLYIIKQRHVLWIYNWSSDSWLWWENLIQPTYGKRLSIPGLVRE